jgi:hypothetical protein
VIVFLGLASVFHAAIVMTVLACIGLWLRHGGLGPLAIAAAVPAVLAAPFVLFSWPIPAWMTLLGVATLLFGLAIIRRRIVPLRSAIGLTFGMALSGAAVISAEILVSPTDDDFAFAQSTPAILTMIVGLIVFGLGLADTGRWLRSEQPVRIPPLPAPTRARPATS